MNILKHSKRLLAALIVTSIALPVSAELMEHTTDSNSTRTSKHNKIKNSLTLRSQAASWKVAPKLVLYPKILEKLDLEHYTVTVRLLVDTEGNIENASIVYSSGSPDLDAVTLKALQKAKFKPFTQNGRKVKGMVDVPIDYNITQPSEEEYVQLESVANKDR